MSVGSFPDLTLVEPTQNRAVDGDTVGRPSTGPLEEAAAKLIAVRDYLFEAEEPTSPENMAQLRVFLQRIYGNLTTITALYDVDQGNGTSDQGTAGSTADLDTRSAASRAVRDAAAVVRDATVTARTCTRVMKQVAEDWETLRTDLDRSPDNRRAHYRALLDSQQEVEDSITALAQLLRQFVGIVAGTGEGGSGSAGAGHPRRGCPRGGVIDGRPHYIPWEPRIVGRAG